MGLKQPGLFAVYDAQISVYCGVISTKISAGVPLVFVNLVSSAGHLARCCS